MAYDLTMTRNWIRKPASWIGSKWEIKNLIELKTVHRVLIEGNVLDGSWAQAQTGYGVLFKSTCNGLHNENTEDVTFRNNYMTHVGAGFEITGRESQSGDCQLQYPSERTQRILIENNKIDSINVGGYTGDARLFLVGGLQDAIADLTIRYNSVTSPNANLNAFLVLTAVAPPAVDRFDFDANVISEGRYGLFTDNAWPLNTAAAPNTFLNNIIVRESYVNYPNTYPATNTVVSSGYPDAFNLAAQSGIGVDAGKLSTAIQGVVTP